MWIVGGSSPAGGDPGRVHSNAGRELPQRPRATLRSEFNRCAEETPDPPTALAGCPWALWPPSPPPCVGFDVEAQIR